MTDIFADPNLLVLLKKRGPQRVELIRYYDSNSLVRLKYASVTSHPSGSVSIALTEEGHRRAEKLLKENCSC